MVEDKVNEMQVNQAVSAEKIARLQDDMEELARSMSELNKTLAAINVTLSEAKGSVRMLMLVGGISAAIGSGIAEIIHLWR